jgi:acetyl esterase/lipase
MVEVVAAFRRRARPNRSRIVQSGGTLALMPRTRLDRYGPERGQIAELWEPTGTAPERGWPVAVVVHGGFWRQLYTKRLMHAVCADLAAHGLAAWNIEYRRVGSRSGGGWPATFEDVTAAVDHLDHLARAVPLDLSRVVATGHSAGGHLVLWAAAGNTEVRIAGVVALAPVTDLEEAARTGAGAGAVISLLGGWPDEVPDRYASASPIALLPIGVPQVVVHGTADESVPFQMSERYVDRARAAGDRATIVELDGVSHMTLVRAKSEAWAVARSHIGRLAAVDA